MSQLDAFLCNSRPIGILGFSETLIIKPPINKTPLCQLFAELSPDDRIGPNLADAFERLIRDTSPDLILAPQGVGGHVDHMQVVRALRGAQPPLPVLWWRDFPYAARPQVPAEPFAEDFAAMPNREVMLDTALSQVKHEACRAYASASPRTTPSATA